MSLNLTDEQRAIFRTLSESDRYRGELLDAAGGTYQSLQTHLKPLEREQLVTYHFDADTAQIFSITQKGRSAIGLASTFRLPFGGGS